MRDQAHASGRSAAGVSLAQGEAPIFSPGDRIRTTTRSPVGHCCVPTHLRRKAGVVDMAIEPTGVDLARKSDEVEAWYAADASAMTQEAAQR